MAPLLRKAGFVVCGFAVVQICAFHVSSAQTVGSQEDEVGFLRKVVTRPEEESELGNKILLPEEAQDYSEASDSPAARRLQALKESSPEETDEAVWDNLLDLPDEETDDGAVAQRRLSMDDDMVVEPADEAHETELEEPTDTGVEENTEEEQNLRRLLASEEELEEKQPSHDEVKDQEHDDAEQLVRRLLASEEELEEEKESLDEVKDEENIDAEQLVRRLLASEEELEEEERYDEMEEQNDIAGEQQLTRNLVPSEDVLDEEGRREEPGSLAARQLAAEEENAVKEFDENNQFTETGEPDAVFLQTLESAGVLTRRLLGEEEDVTQENAAEALSDILVDAMGSGPSDMSEKDLSEIAEAVKDAVEELNREVESGALAIPDEHGAPIRRLAAALENGVNGIGDLNALLDLASQSVNSIENEADATPGETETAVGPEDAAVASAGGSYDEAAARTKEAARELQVALRIFLGSLATVLREGPIADAQSAAGVLKNKFVEGGEQLGKATEGARDQVKQSFLRMLTNALVTIAKYNPDIISMAIRLHRQAQEEAAVKAAEAN